MNKLVRPVRRSLGVLMAIALCLGTSAIWGSPAQAGDVTPGPIKTSSNFELTQLSIVQTVRDAGGKLVPAGEDKTMQVYHTARLSFDWKAPSPAKKGMSFTVSLPETLRGIVGKLTFEYTTCDITADGATMKCVLNDKADGLNQVSGHIDLALDVKKATREKTATVKIDGKAVPIDLPGPGGINPEPSKPTGTRKDGWQVTSDMKNRPNAVNWRIFFSGKTSYEIVDSRVGNNAFIRWWCVKGQDANVAEGRYGEGGVRPAGTLNVKKKSDGTSIANTDPMNRSGLLHEGIVITPPALDYACGIDIIDWDALSSGGVAVNKTDNTVIINGRQYGATAIRKQSGGGSDQGYPYPHIDIVKKDAAGNDANTDAVELAGKNLDAQGVGSTDLKFTVKNDSSVEDLKQVVVTDTTSGSGTVESMACTFPGENAPTKGVYDAGSKKWTVKWAASFANNPQLLKTGVSFPCTARLTGVTLDQVHTDNSTVTGIGAKTGTAVKDEDPYKAKVPPRPSIDIEKADESGRDADTAGESAMLPNGSTRLSFTVRNTSGEAEKNVVVKDVVAKGGQVSNLSCTFPDGSTASDPQGAQVRWEKSFAAQPAVFAKGASFTCSADLSGVPVRTGESGSTHQDTASVEADGAISGLHTSDTDPYNAHRPPEPKVKIVKKDAAGNDADTEKDAVALPGGQTDLVFDVRNPGPEALHDIVVSDTTSTESGTVESMQCTFPGENAPTAGVYDAGSKKWTVKWAASFGQNPKTFAVGGSFGCTARLTGVAATVHTDTAAVDGKGAVSTLGVHDDNPYNGLPPKPGISVDKKDKAGNAADTADTAPVLPRAQAELAFTVRNSGADPLKEVEVVDETTTDSGTVESMQCTFPGENAPTKGVYDAKAKKWTVKWAASFGQNPKTLAIGQSYSCTAKLTGVTEKLHTDKAIASATGALSGKGVKDENPYNAKPPSPKVSIVKKDAAGNDADDPHDPVRLASGTADLKFTVTNPGTEDLKKVVVTDTTSTESGTVESMACTFPGEKAPTAGVYDAASKKWTVKWDASWKDADPAAFAAGASFPCTAKLTGVTQTLHTDTSTVEGAGYGSGKTVKDENPYNAVPPTPHTSIDKSDAKGNGGDTLADAPVLETGQTDLKFKVVNNGGEPLREIVVTDETVAGSGKVESMACTFPGENAPTKGVYDAGSKKWTVKWAASFGDKPTLFRISDSFACTAKLTGVTKVYHTDTAKVTGTGSISAKGVTGENPYNALPKNPNVEIVKKDVKGRDADKAADAAVLAPDGKTGKGAVDLDFTVVNNGGEALKQVVVTDTTTTSSGTVESMACTFPGEKAPTAGVYDAKAKKWTVKWDASFAAQKPSSFAIGASFKCTAHLSGVTGDVHTDDATIAGVGIGSGKSVSDENPYNARVPGKPNVDIEKVDAKGNDADTVAESVLLPQGKTDLVFTIVNTGNESLRAIEVTDKATGSGKVSDLTCTFPDGTKGTRWEASFAAQNPARLAIGGSFTCTAKLTGVEAGKKHADTATVTGTGFVSGTGVTDSDGYHAHRSPDPTPKPTPSHPGEPTPSKSTPVTPKTAKPKPKLPRTGADVRLLGVVALGLAAAGGVVVAVRRGRKSGDGEA